MGLCSLIWYVLSVSLIFGPVVVDEIAVRMVVFTVDAVVETSFT